jgi:hypothetical protein
MITFELRVENLQNYCRDEVEPFLKQTVSGGWRWQVEHREIEIDYGVRRWRKTIRGIIFFDAAEANFFLLKYPNLIK